MTAGRTRAHAFLARLGSVLAVREDVDLEYSIRLRPGRVEAWGRLGCWLGGSAPADFEEVAAVLALLDAPPAVRAAHRAEQRPVRQGIAAELTGAAPEFRLYLHGRDPLTLADRYHGWRWRPAEAPRQGRYHFHFLPETPAGVRPLALVPEPLRGAFRLLLREERLRQLSGFWLREGPDGRLDQLDLAFPWAPTASTLEGLRAAARLFDLDARGRATALRLPVRHVAVALGGAPALTLYAAAPRAGSWPVSEAQLQRQVRRGARDHSRAVETRIFQQLPAPPAAPRTPLAGRFYDGPVALWRTVLGPRMHYHFGLFGDADPLSSPPDAALEAALERAVTELYPHIPAGGRLYDVGCGWGGPLEHWTRALGCRALGLTNSRTQFRYVAQRGLPVRWGDAERTLPPGHFDCAVLLESLSHMRDKARLLRVLRHFSDRLVMRVHCQDAAPPGPAFAGTMHVVSSTALRALIESAGWRICHWRNRRPEALPTIAGWHRRLEAVPPTADPHLETLRAWCAGILTAPLPWARNNPLIEVAAD